MSRAHFVDLSQWNAEPATIDWQAYKQWSSEPDGVSRLCLRATYGNGYVDQHFAAYRAGALSAGIDQVIFYSYSYPQLNTPIAEANWLARVVGAIRPTDTLMLDIEENVPQASGEWALQWLQQCRQNYPDNEIVVYASSSFIASHLQDSRLAAYPLFLANWQDDPNEQPLCPAPWKEYRYLQYTDHATTVPGIPGTVDADVFTGVLDVSEKVLDSSEVSQWFVPVNTTTWQAKDKSGKPALDASGNPLVVRDGMLAYLRSGRASDAALGNFTRLGLPRSNEMTVGTNVAEQRFERGVLRWDPQHVADNPPGSGNCYLIQLSAYYSAYHDVPVLQQQLKDTQTQLQQCATTLKVTGQQLLDAQTALAAASDHQYATAALAAQAILAKLPPYPAAVSTPKAMDHVDE